MGSHPILNRKKSGFTLIELMVVIAIIAVAYAIIAPRLPKLASTQRSETIKKIAYTCEAMFEHAAAKKKV